MKNVLLALTALSAVAASPAMAQSVEGEVRFGGVANGQVDSTEYRVQYDNNYAGLLNYGIELQTRQATNEGALGSKVSLKVGPALPTVFGFNTAAYGEVGEALNAGNNFEFWGAGAKISRAVPGTALTLKAGYRHREGFTVRNLKEDRLNGGIDWNITEKTAIGANYYRTTGSTRTDQIGVAVTQKF